MSKLRHSTRLFGQFFSFARAHKAYWLVPLVLLLALTVLLIAAGNVSAPFIYTLF